MLLNINGEWLIIDWYTAIYSLFIFFLQTLEINEGVEMVFFGTYYGHDDIETTKWQKQPLYTLDDTRTPPFYYVRIGTQKLKGHSNSMPEMSHQLTTTSNDVGGTVVSP